MTNAILSDPRIRFHFSEADYDKLECCSMMFNRPVQKLDRTSELVFRPREYVVYRRSILSKNALLAATFAEALWGRRLEFEWSRGRPLADRSKAIH